MGRSVPGFDSLVVDNWFLVVSVEGNLCIFESIS